MDTFPLDDLPQEILQYVFSLLSVPDRLKVCLVCKKWLNLMNARYLLSDIVMHFDVKSDITNFDLSRNFPNLSFRSILFDNDHYAFMRRVSPIVQYISFEKCFIRNFRRPILFNDISFQNLKVLKLIDCDLWILFPNLPNLTELYLSGNNVITDEGLAILQKSMKSLEAFSFYCFVNFDPRSYNRFYPQNSSYEKEPSPYILSFPAFKSFITERANTLKELNLYFNVDSHALTEISRIENLCLHKISLENCSDSVKGLITLFKNQPNLKSLNLNGIMGLNVHIIKALYDLLPNIEEVYICNGSFTDDTFSYVFQLKKLKRLNISNNYASESGFFEAVEKFEPIHLRYLNVSGIKVTNIDLLIHKCRNLVELNLSHCAVSDDLLLFISENLIHLQNLSIKKTDVTDYGLTGIPEMRINVNAAQEVNQNNHKPLSNLKDLKELHLSYCENITDNGIAIAIRFQYLEFLDLIGCHILNYDTVITLFQENPNLKKIFQDYHQQVPADQEAAEFVEGNVPD